MSLKNKVDRLMGKVPDAGQAMLLTFPHGEYLYENGVLFGARVFGEGIACPPGATPGPGTKVQFGIDPAREPVGGPRCP